MWFEDNNNKLQVLVGNLHSPKSWNSCGILLLSSTLVLSVFFCSSLGLLGLGFTTFIGSFDKIKTNHNENTSFILLLRVWANRSKSNNFYQQMQLQHNIDL